MHNDNFEFLSCIHRSFPCAALPNCLCSRTAQLLVPPPDSQPSQAVILVELRENRLSLGQTSESQTSRVMLRQARLRTKSRDVADRRNEDAANSLSTWAKVLAVPKAEKE